MYLTVKLYFAGFSAMCRPVKLYFARCSAMCRTVTLLYTVYCHVPHCNFTVHGVVQCAAL